MAANVANGLPRHLVVVGGGIMGSGIAAIFMAGGWRVDVVSPSQKTRATLSDRVSAACSQIIDTRLPGVLGVHAALSEIDWPDVDLVIEAVSEDIALKRDIFRQLDLLAAPDIPLASNTSNFPITDLAKGLRYPERVVGAHFFMPAHLVPLVEVIQGMATLADVAENLTSWLTSLGKHPIRVKKDVPGFIANRIQHAMMREALYLMEDGVASADDIDAAVRFGFGFRFIACGPILQKEISGWDTNCSAGNALYPHLNNSDHYPPRLQRRVAAGHVGVKRLSGIWTWDEESAGAEKARIERLLQAGLKILRSDT